jgi:hypothetical protein
MSGPPHVLVSPLDWGLGHASRIIPVISRYISCGYRVTIGGSGKSGALLRRTFPDLPFITIPSFKIYCAGNGIWLIFSIILQLPEMFFCTIREHQLLKNIVARHKINIVVSDNRYGLFNSSTYNIFITHQISPVLPFILQWAEFPLYLILSRLIHQFDECWIPDYMGESNLSGRLSHRYKLPRNARFIGILSRFAEGIPVNPDSEKFDLVIVLSGPQPQLKKLTRLILFQVMQESLETLIITGLQDSIPPQMERPGLTVVTHLETEAFKNALVNATTIICRSGYSGIMDLVTLGKTAMLIPTPGQSEQQYLAKYLSEKGLFHYMKQSEFNLQKLVPLKKSYRKFSAGGREILPIMPLFEHKNNNHYSKPQ